MRFTGKYFLLIILSFYYGSVCATHYRAGEVLYKVIGPLQYQVTVITYTKISGTSIDADRDTIDVDWGDGTSSTFPRINGPVGNNGFHKGVIVETDVKKNEYQNTHTYASLPPPPNYFFVLQFFDENRMAGVLNINANNGGSVNVPFYIEDTLFFPADINAIGYFSSPVLENPAVQYANVCQPFYTNPEAVDPDADSLDYQLIACKQDQNDVVPFYSFPNTFCNTAGLNCGLGPNSNTCTIDKHTGNFVWANPCATGNFNVGILMHIYRHGLCIGTMLRDMQIIVLNVQNLQPPQLIMPADTCVRAGDTLIQHVSATDPNDSIVSITAVGDPFNLVNSPARFDSVAGRPTATGTFIWNTTCDDIQKQSYKTYFTAANNYQSIGPGGVLSPYPMKDIKTWQIHVIPPPVEELTGTISHSNVTLTWQNPYKCASNSNFRGFSVWRKTGCDPFVPGYCETGLAGTGYVKITTSNISTYTYTDNSVVPGQAYSYRVLAEFYKLPPNGIVTLQYDNQQSVPSNEVCVNAPITVPVILNVDVTQTDAVNGQIYVRWQKPLAGGLNLDTLADPPVYRLDLYRGNGFNFSNPVLLQSYTYPSYSAMPDTISYLGGSINTQDSAWSYRVYFYGNNNNSVIDTIGASASASSVFLRIQPSDETLLLHWNYNVPWVNDSFTIYRENHITNIYDSIAIAYTAAYVDTGLQNDTTYCYYVKSYGHYTSGFFPQPLLNRSQRLCAVPVDTVPPCPPILIVTNDCDLYTGQPWNAPQFINHLIWSNDRDSICVLNIKNYHIYYSNSDSANYTLLDSTASISDTTYNHTLSDNLAGCYAITAISRSGVESRFSNIVCIDNCPYYVLPNAFTPNGDGHNDLFHPYEPYRFVPKIEMKIYNRWGELVFETTDPDINWNGNDKSGKPVSDGVYLYAGYYYEQHVNGLVRKPLSGEKKGGGFIHLIRK